MSTIIGADAAKLAGLQIDTLQKVRSGQVTLDHLEWFNRLSKRQRDVLAGSWWTLFGPGEQLGSPTSSVVTEKFALLVNLGIITVPDDYDHATALAKFRKKNRKKFSYYNYAITDTNFPNPTRILKPGEKLQVRVFKQIVGGTTTSEERLAFLATQKAIHTGAQGVSLVFDQKCDQLPKDQGGASFDEPDRLWADAGGYRRVPRLDANSDGGFGLDLGHFGNVWNDDNAFLCFCNA